MEFGGWRDDRKVVTREGEAREKGRPLWRRRRSLAPRWTDRGESSLLRFMLNGRAREMGLGPLHAIGLADARERARNCRHLLVDGIDPLNARNAEKARRVAEAAAAIPFERAAESYVKAHHGAWRNAKHAWQWTATLKAHVYPVIGALSVAAVDTAHVVRILEPIWTNRAETASRVRGRIEAWRRTMRRRTAGAPARTPHGGKGTWRTCSRPGERRRASSTMLHCRGPRSARLWPSLTDRAVPPRWRCGSRS